jgi:hypothetical protein
MPHTYEVATVNRAGRSHVHRYTSDEALGPGDILRLEGRYWLLVRAEQRDDPGPDRMVAIPANYRLRLRHPDGREEVGAMRRFRTGAPRLGHAFTTVEDGRPASWQIIDEHLSHDDAGGPYLDLVAERDYGEVEALPDHELEHALAAAEERADAAAMFDRAAEAGLALELVALEPGEEPDWAEAERYIDALVLEEIGDDLLELCGVHPASDARESWLSTVMRRLRSDLDLFRTDIEGDRDEIEQWDFLDGRVFASVGSFEDEADPDRGHGWMCRLVDSGALAAAGFARVRKARLDV